MADSDDELKEHMRAYSLHDACSSGDIEYVKYLVEHWTEDSVGKRLCAVDERGDDQSSALHLACVHDHVNIVQFLLKNGANVNQRDVYDNTPLHVSIMGDCDAVVRTLLAFDSDISAKNKNGWTPLHIACCHGNFDIVRRLIDSGADIFCKDNDGYTAMEDCERFQQLVIPEDYEIVGQEFSVDKDLRGKRLLRAILNTRDERDSPVRRRRSVSNAEAEAEAKQERE